mmetsp:Transcript_3655/g.6389  ORF Transcript_3655/g.6389 Transcript_3655/m.6389 type:complete len:239 (+) Transcript_3655:3704-4420(+)
MGTKRPSFRTLTEAVVAPKSTLVGNTPRGDHASVACRLRERNRGLAPAGVTKGTVRTISRRLRRTGVSGLPSGVAMLTRTALRRTRLPGMVTVSVRMKTMTCCNGPMWVTPSAWTSSSSWLLNTRNGWALAWVAGSCNPPKRAPMNDRHWMNTSEVSPSSTPVTAHCPVVKPEPVVMARLRSCNINSWSLAVAARPGHVTSQFTAPVAHAALNRVTVGTTAAAATSLLARTMLAAAVM